MPGGHTPFGCRAAGVPGLFLDPAQLSHLELYLKSDSSDILALANGATVTTWADQSGNNRGIFGIYNGTPKKVGNASPAGLPMISIGVNTGMAGQGFGTPGVDNSLGITLYVYYSQDSIPGGQQEFLLEWPQTPQATTLWALDQTNGTDYAARGGNPASALDIGPSQVGTHIMAVRANPPAGTGTLEMMLDGVLSGLSVVQNARMQNTYEIGCSTGGNLSLTGKVGAVVAFSIAHDNRTMRGVTNFLRRHWG